MGNAHNERRAFQKWANSTETDRETRRKRTPNRLPMETGTPMKQKQKRKRRHRPKHGKRRTQTDNLNTNRNHNRTYPFIDNQPDTPEEHLLPPIQDPPFKRIGNQLGTLPPLKENSYRYTKEN